MKRILLLFIVFLITSPTIYSQVIPEHKKHNQDFLQETQSGSIETKLYGYSDNKKTAFTANDYGNSPKWKWSSDFGGSGNDSGCDIASDSEGNIYQLSYFSGTTSIGGATFKSTGSKDALIIKFNGEGNVIWSRQFSTTDRHIIVPKKLCVNNNGNLVFTGYYTGIASFDDFTLPEANSNELFFVKMSSDGIVLLAKHYSSEYLNNLKPQTDEFGNIYILTEKENDDYESPITILKFDTDGTFITKYQNSSNFSDFRIKDNTIYYAGTINENGVIGDSTFHTSSFDAFLATSDLSFDFNWAYMVEHASTSEYAPSFGKHLLIDENNNIYFTGIFNHDIVFFGAALNTPGTFAVKIENKSTTKWLSKIDNYNTFDNRECYIALLNNSVGITSYYSKKINLLEKNTGTVYSNYKLDNPFVAITGANNALYLSGNESGHIYLSKFNSLLEPQFHKEYSGDSGYGLILGTETDSKGNIYVYGYASTEMSYYNETLHKGAFLAKHNANSDLVWLRQFPGIRFKLDTNPEIDLAFESGPIVEVDPNNQYIYITGFFIEAFELPGGPSIQPEHEMNLIICKYDLNGNFSYAIQEQADQESFNICLSADHDGNIIMSSLIRRTSVIGGGQSSNFKYDGFFIEKYNAYGNLIWVKRSASSSSDYESLVTTDTEGNIYFTGEADGDIYIKFDGEEVPLKDGDGNIVLSKLSPDGNLLWFKTIGGSPLPVYNGDFKCWPTGILTKKDNEIYIKGCHGDSCWFDNIMLGNPNSNFNKFILKINEEGDVQWANSIKERVPSFDDMSMDLDNAGNVYSCMQARDTIRFGSEYSYVPTGSNDLVISQYSTNGVLKWVKALKSGTFKNRLKSIAVFDTTTLFVGGFYNDYIALDNKEYFSENIHGFLGLMKKYTIGLQEVYDSNSKVKVYPNPFSTKTTIEFDNPNHQPYSLKLIDASGKTVFKQNGITSDKIVFMKNELPKGIYVFQLSGNRYLSGKLVIE